jgi:trk system potassium uptake protein TrkH
MRSRLLTLLRPAHPAQVVVLAFGVAAVLGTLLLLLPVSRADRNGAPVVDALFTATSAVTITGLNTVDTPTYWSGFGHVVILLLIQVGGFGIMSLATLLGLLVSHRLGLRMRLSTAAETKTLGIGDVRRVLVGVARTSLLFEAAGAVVLSVRLVNAYDEPWGRALWLGLFHSVSAFNNGGFALFSDSLSRFVTDPVVSLTVCILVITGGLGFPVLFELYRAWRTPRRWTVHTKIVVLATSVLLSVGTVAFLAREWSNPATLGPLDVGGKALAGFFLAVMPRSGGLNTVSTGELYAESLLLTDVLMFIGGGSAGTAGGIKVTTFTVLLFVILTEIRADRSVVAFDRHIPSDAQRQALTVALLSVASVVGGTGALMALTPFSLDQALFEVISAFATVGLSTGITGDLGTPGTLLLVVLMFIGRLGPITLASALALRSRPRLYELPQERPIIG